MNPNLTFPTSSSLTQVRYYQPLDPYFYTVDNRPLSDLDANISTVLTGPVSTVFRAVALGSGYFDPVSCGVMGDVSTTAVFGLAPRLTGSGTIEIGRGGLIFKEAHSAAVPTQVIRTSLNHTPVTLAIPAPITLGSSVNYLVEAIPTPLSAANLPSSTLPLSASADLGLPGLLAPSELRISVKAGTASATGSQTTPAVDAGATPLMVVTVSQAGTVTITEAVGAPTGLMKPIAPAYAPSTTSGAGTSTNSGLTIPTFADAASQSVSFRVDLTDQKIDPTKPLKLSALLSSNASNGVVAFKVSFNAFGDGTSTASAAIDSAVETVTMASANTGIRKTFTTAVIPTAVFSGWDSNQVWSVLNPVVLVQLTRLGGDVLDTHSGAVSLLALSVSQ